jgi:hypothetical protein
VVVGLNRLIAINTLLTDGYKSLLKAGDGANASLMFEGLAVHGKAMDNQQGKKETEHSEEGGGEGQTSPCCIGDASY